jgi:hypothetical protein
MAITVQFQIRGGTAAEWTAANPILMAKEPGLETDTNKIKFGDGVTAWNSLSYFIGSAGGGDMLKSIYDPTTKSADAFSMGNMAETTTAKVMTGLERANLANQSGINTGDETSTTIKTKLGITTLSGSNTGDQTLPTGGTPAIVLGTANTAGISANFLRDDDTILAFDATVPSTQAFGDSAVVGTASVAARRDHKHAMPTAPTLAGLGGVPTTTTVNGHALNANVTVTASDVGAPSGSGSSTGTNTGDETAATIETKLSVTSTNVTALSNLSGTNTGDETTARIATINHGATVKTTPVDADEVNGQDSASSFSLVKTTWLNIKAYLKTYFDTLYQAVLVSGTNIKTVGGASLLGSGDIPVSGTGTVTSVSVTTNANFSGTVTNPSTTPAISLSLLNVDGGTY